MYKALRYLRMVVALIAMAIPTFALLAGYESIFFRMQLLTALISGSLLCLVFWVASAFVYGRIYCSAVCPLGTAMDGVSVLGRAVARQRRRYRWCPSSPALRLGFLIAALAMILAGGAVLPTLLDPFSAYARMVTNLIGVPLDALLGRPVAFSLAATALAAVYAVGILAVARRRGRLICNTVCPVGTLLGAASRRSVFHIEINPDKCIACGECERVCKCQCINLADLAVDNSRCVVCFDCTAVCPNDAIVYRQGRHRLRLPMLEPTDQKIKPTETITQNTPE